MTTPLIDWLDAWECGKPPSNIILLTSVENQEQANKRIPELLKIPAVCRGLSLEPLLGPVDLTKAFGCWCGGFGNKGTGTRMDIVCPICDEHKASEISWIIIGGESGPSARVCKTEWIQDLVDQGKAANVATFVKQFSGKKSGQQGELPDELFNVKEFPVMP